MFGSALYNAFYGIYWLMVDRDRKNRAYLMKQFESAVVNDTPDRGEV
jgi:hypothetical protein